VDDPQAGSRSRCARGCCATSRRARRRCWWCPQSPLPYKRPFCRLICNSTDCGGLSSPTGAGGDGRGRPRAAHLRTGAGDQLRLPRQHAAVHPPRGPHRAQQLPGQRLHFLHAQLRAGGAGHRAGALACSPVEWNELGFDALGGDALVSPVACCQQPQRVCCAYAWGSGCGSCCVMATPCRIADGQGRKFDRGLHSVGVGSGR
jgi:hypothetical protein